MAADTKRKKKAPGLAVRKGKKAPPAPTKPEGARTYFNRAFGKSACGKLVADARQPKMSQAALAAAVGVTRTCIAHIEQGRGLPGADLLKEVGKALRIKISDIEEAVAKDRGKADLKSRRQRGDNGAEPAEAKAKKRKSKKATPKKKAPPEAKARAKAKVAPAPKKEKIRKAEPAKSKKAPPKKKAPEVEAEEKPAVVDEVVAVPAAE